MRSITSGKAFKHFIFCELCSYCEYLKDRRPLTFWRDYQGNEVDFILGDDLAIEVKSTDMVTEKHMKGLKQLSEGTSFKHKLIVSLDPSPRTVGDVEILPWKEFLNRLWSGIYK